MKLSHSCHVSLLLTFSNEQQGTRTAGIHGHDQGSLLQEMQLECSNEP